MKLIHPDTMYVYRLPEPWESAIRGWTAWLKRSIARRTATASPADLTLDDVVILFSDCDWSRERRRSMRTSLDSFCGWAVIRGLVEVNVGAQLPRVSIPPAAPRPATEVQWRELLVAAAPRERLMARLAGELGLRRAEVARCHLRDLVPDGGRWALIVTGKGGRQRTVPVPDDLAAEIRDYCPGGWLFPGPHGHLSPKYVGTVISRMLGPTTTMHQLRHRFASQGYQATHDLRALQSVLGHSSLATTQRYVQAADDAERKLVEAVGKAS
jgi:integrase